MRIFKSVFFICLTVMLTLSVLSIVTNTASAKYPALRMSPDDCWCNNSPSPCPGMDISCVEGQTGCLPNSCSE